MKKTPKITSINVRVDDDIKAKVIAIAEARGITISQLVREWFKQLTEKEDNSLSINN